MADLNARQLRLAQGLTLDQMAKRCGVSVSALSRMESLGSYPQPSRVAQVAAGYGCTPKRLMEALSLRESQAAGSARGARAQVKG